MTPILPPILALATALALSGAASAATLDIVETTDFLSDTGLSPIPDVAPNVAMPGVNRITGNLAGLFRDVDTDEVLIEIRAGEVLTDLKFTAVSIALPVDTSPFPELFAATALVALEPLFTFAIDPIPIDLLTASDGAMIQTGASVPAGTYGVFTALGSPVINNVPLEEISVDYVVEFTVTAIPLPSSAWLMLGALGLGGVVTRRARHRGRLA